MTETADGADLDGTENPSTDDRATDLDPATVPRMVDAVAPEWSVERVRPTEEGTDYVAFLTVETPEGRREVVLKAFSGDGVSARMARSEPRVLRLLADETTIPVPEVVGFVDDHADLPAPFFLAERLPGENGSGRFADLSTPALERVLAGAGDHLAQLHELQSFDRFGRIGVADGDGTGSDLPVVGDESDGDGSSDESDTHPVGPRERWTDWLLADAENTLDGLAGGRFDDLVGPLREYVREAVPALDAPDRGAIVHWDYRLGNLLVDPDTGETTGVLDWADLVAGDPVYNLATVEDHNVNWQTRDVVLRRRLRERFRDAYEARRSDDWRSDDGRTVDGTSDDGRTNDGTSTVRERKRVYHLCNRLNAMACLPDWYANADPAIRDERAAEHRTFVREYLE